MFQGEPELHFILNVLKKANASFSCFFFFFAYEDLRPRVNKNLISSDNKANNYFQYIKKPQHRI